MPLTKQQKIYLGILALAAGAWSVDRFILGGANTSPQAASAGLLAGDKRAARPANPLSPTTKPSLCGRFADFAGKIPMLENAAAPDAFVPPPQWLRSALRSPQLATPGVAPASVDVEQFRRENKLSAILRAGRNDAAVINGVLVQVGQKFGPGGGYQLMSVTPKSATLVVGGTRVVLQIEGSR
jgi:hypothetical protein